MSKKDMEVELVATGLEGVVVAGCISKNDPVVAVVRVGAGAGAGASKKEVVEAAG